MASMAGVASKAEQILFGAGAVGARGGAGRAGRAVGAQMRRRWGQLGRSYESGGLMGIYGTVREPVMGGMIKGALIGAGANAAITVVSNASAGAPLMSGVLGSAFSGGLMGGAIGGGVGFGGFMGRPPRFGRGGNAATPAAAGGGGGMRGRMRGWADRNVPTFMGAARRMRTAAAGWGGVAGGANIAANNRTNVMMATAGLGVPTGPSRMAPNLLNARTRRGWSNVGVQAQDLMGG